MELGQQSLLKYLVVKSREGDRKAQNELYKLHVNAMYNICRRMMGNDEDARDVLQDSFVDAFGKLDKLKEEVTFPAWLKRITINNSINSLRKRKHFESGLDETLEIAEPDSGDDLDYQKQEANKIMKAIDKISEGCRTVLNLYIFEGYDHKEIGEILSITESASKAQYSKAKSKIRKILSEG